MKKKNIFLSIAVILLIGLAYIGLRVVMTVISIVLPFIAAILMCIIIGLFYYKVNNKNKSKNNKEKNVNNKKEEKHEEDK